MNWTLSRDFILAQGTKHTHEIFDIIGRKKGRKGCFGPLKIDMSKAYDRLD